MQGLGAEIGVLFVSTAVFVFLTAGVRIFDAWVMPADPAMALRVQALLIAGYIATAMLVFSVRRWTEAQHEAEERARTEAELRRAHEQLGEAHAHLQEEQDLRMKLVDTVVHDIAQPLSPIHIELELMERRIEEAPDRAKEGVQVVRRNVMQLDRLVRDLLELGRLATERFRLHLDDVDVDRLVAETVRTFEGPADQKKIDLRADGACGTVVRADPNRLTEIAYNLVVNAIKYGGKGTTVRVGAMRDRDQVVLHVADDGPGLTREEITHIFEPFERGAHGAEANGMGVGLYIVRRLVEAHGGEISATSPGPGMGATFRVVLPIKGPSKEDAATAAAEVFGGRAQGAEPGRKARTHPENLVVGADAAQGEAEDPDAPDAAPASDGRTGLMQFLNWRR